MARLHSASPRPILHHDLKSNNILVFDGWLPKIADFGLSVGGGLSTLSQTRAAGAGTLAYTAPELFGEDDIDGGTEPEFTKVCDVYAFGMVTWEIITREVPWADKLDRQIINALVRELRPRMSEEQAEGFMGKLAVRCWAQAPEARPTFTELLPLFGGRWCMQDVDLASSNPWDDAPEISWGGVDPALRCIAGLRQNAAARESLADLEGLVSSVQEKVREIRSGVDHDAHSLAARLDDDELAAIVAYTHDLQLPEQAGNLYFELNNSLRAATPEALRTSMGTWGELVHYILRGLLKLPSYEGVVLRGVEVRVLYILSCA